MESSTGKPRLLVIGGGFAGVKLAFQCRKFAEVTLVDPKDYIEITWATVRGIIDDRVASRSIIEYKDIPNIGRVLQGTVTRLTPQEATLSTGEVLPFDYAALCCGSSYSDSAFKSAAATTRGQRLAELQALSETIRAAKRIVVVGGGPAGVEAAAEVVEAYAGKAVTLVTRGAALLADLPPKAGRHAQAWLEKHGVKVLLGTGIAGAPPGPGPAVLTLTPASSPSTSDSSSSSLAADLVLWCTGAAPNTSFLAGAEKEKGAWAEGAAEEGKEEKGSWLDAKGAVKVLPSLQLPGRPHMFALGDCCDVKETKLGYLAMQQAELAARNLRALIRARRCSPSASPRLASWAPHTGAMALMLVTLGRGDGVCRWGGAVCGGCLPACFKSRTLFVDHTRKELGVREGARQSCEKTCAQASGKVVAAEAPSG
ncbi:hypothetical protein Agub_g11590 [Astrephomene gubernaculifera]|uniref:FAD/NAD(P)-binding domain-containing protein n=1 Tax=Astrephomene gubernaculifera TaxID=47775 RepID=A0AAD3E197_9CHLO|nr:hypothetical protein Agub_g11590 [Astrephomene gubernaculifera]